jgi:class 3 adenylate cyclase/pimeloyl-ACP methyl ester carboxylesterase
VTPEIKYARNGDVSIAYQVVGNGPVDIIYVPPFVSNLELQWQEPEQARYLQRLASFSRLVMFDKRGTGLSDRTGIATLEERMDDVRAVMDAVGLERGVVFGTSEGGAMSLLFTATYPERVQALILYGAYARQVAAPDYPEGISPEIAKDRMEALRTRWGQGIMAGFMAAERVADPAFLERQARWERLSASPGAVVALYQMICELDVRHLLTAVKVPTLILHREGDPTHAPKSRFLGRHIPGARMVELPGKEYYPFFGDQDAIFGEIEEFLTGTRSRPDVDRVLATVLFTDIIDSTRKAVELGDQKWRELLESHHSLIRDELKRFRGREIDTAGDGFFAVFDGPARAIRAAVAIVEKLLKLGIPVRAGIHTGECDVMDNKLSGVAVHTGARVASLARPGEVLVSSTVKDLVAGSGLRFGDRGVHELKGIPGVWQLYSVIIDG